MPGIPVKPAVVAELIRQMNYEWSAAHAYLGLAIWCDDQNYKGFSKYFHKQAGEEREHALKLMDHLLDRGVLPVLAAIAQPKTEFAALPDVARQAQAMESANTGGINAAYEAAVKEKDFAAQVMLQWFINEQVEEEAWCDEMVERVDRAACAGALMDLDRHIEKLLTAETHAEGDED